MDKKSFSKWSRFAEAIETPSSSIKTISSLRESLKGFPEVVDKVVSNNHDVVLIGEGSHGTHEFYDNRIQLTKALITQGKCQSVLIEGDLPDTAELHRYVMDHPLLDRKTDIYELFKGFERFPSWMWANEDVFEFIKWLKEHNSKLPMEERCGIWGLDIYSMTL